VNTVIYHNPRCSKSRQALSLLEAAGANAQVVRYLENPPSAEELDALLTKLGLEPVEVMRKQDDLFKELGLVGKTLSREEGLRLLAEHPALLERPIVVRGDKAVVARPPERVSEVL
jgi:arsenate reductase